jgi:hypothetical protein
VVRVWRCWAIKRSNQVASLRGQENKTQLPAGPSWLRMHEDYSGLCSCDRSSDSPAHVMLPPLLHSLLTLCVRVHFGEQREGGRWLPILLGPRRPYETTSRAVGTRC